MRTAAAPSVTLRSIVRSSFPPPPSSSPPLPPPPLTAEAVEKSQIAFLKIPVTSVKGWANYVRSLSALHELPYQCFVTAISTRPDPKSQFKIVFEANEKLPEKLQRLTFARCDAIQEEIMAPYSPPSDDAPVAPKRSGKRKF